MAGPETPDRRDQPENGQQIPEIVNGATESLATFLEDLRGGIYNAYQKTMAEVKATGGDTNELDELAGKINNIGPITDLENGIDDVTHDCIMTNVDTLKANETSIFDKIKAVKDLLSIANSREIPTLKLCGIGIKYLSGAELSDDDFKVVNDSFKKLPEPTQQELKRQKSFLENYFRSAREEKSENPNQITEQDLLMINAILLTIEDNELPIRNGSTDSILNTDIKNLVENIIADYPDATAIRGTENGLEVKIQGKWVNIINSAKTNSTQT